MQHTPGPWIADGIWIGTMDHETVAYADHHRNQTPRPLAQREADARLIAAAPELYKALEALAFAATLEGPPTARWQPLLLVAHAALVKAGKYEWRHNK